MKPIPTTYAGCRFRSRLEARWAVFFDRLKIDWQYEPQGYVVGGRPYLPDFLLTTSGTWVEVKGNSEQLHPDFMMAASRELPLLKGRGEVGPRLMILGPLPQPSAEGDWGWVGLDPGAGLDFVTEGRYGFSVYLKNGRPWWLGNTDHSRTAGLTDSEAWLTPLLDAYEPSVDYAYEAARSARFEHGESGPAVHPSGPLLPPPSVLDESALSDLMGPEVGLGSTTELPICGVLPGDRDDAVMCCRDRGHGGAHMGLDPNGDGHIWPNG